MTDNANKNLKVRLRFPGGEEFEAEGNREFIEQQRNYFLSLIGKAQPAAPHPSAAPAFKRTTYPLSSAPVSAVTPTPSPLPALSTIPPSQRKETTSTRMEELENYPTLRLWEYLLKEEGDIVVLRKKMRLSPQEAALLLLAGARVLLKKSAYKALDLSQALHKSGFSEGRLDRLIAGDIRNGLLTSEGSKRGRIYRLTNEGFARAFVLAERLAGDNTPL